MFYCMIKTKQWLLAAASWSQSSGVNMLVDNRPVLLVKNELPT